METTTNSAGQRTIWASDTDLIDKPLPWQEQGLSYTATGYGAKIPTSKMIHYEGRDRRIYCTIYSNAGTAWITVRGERVTVNN